MNEIAVENDAELEAIIAQITEEILEEVSAELYDIFLEDYVERYAYQGSNEWYHDGSGEPTGEFLLAWQRRSPKRVADGFESSITYDPTEVSSDASTWKHASQFQGWGSARAFMADLLNVAGSTSSLNWNHREKAYWDTFKKEMFESGGVDKMFAEKARIAGII